MTPWLDTADRIARRLVATAQWHGSACTWEIGDDRPTTAPSSGAGRRAAGAALYQGSAGIAFFLAQHHRVVADADSRRTALGAFEHALAEGATLPEAAWGFHTGRVGIAWTACVAASVLGQPDLETRGLELLHSLAGNEQRDTSLDVIGGAAGAIPALLDLADRCRALGVELPFDLASSARHLGRHLLTTAHQEPDGWTWPTLPHAAVRNLAGFAHGTAGIGLALLELSRRGDDDAGAFAFGAEMAFLAERRAFDARRSNWRDWRNMALSELYRHGAVDRVRDLVLRGAVPDVGATYMAAWCHGAPGIGLSRLRAWRLTGQARYHDELTRAVAGTLPALRDSGHRGPVEGNYSLCHGIAGNAELLLHVARLPPMPSARGPEVDDRLDRPRLLALCEDVAEHGRARYEAASSTTASAWPSGTLGAVPDPSLLLGDAGIGLFYLRLADATTPTPLLLSPRGPSPESADADSSEVDRDVLGESFRASFQDAARRSAEGYFGVTLRAWRRLGEDRHFDASVEAAFDPKDEPLDEAPTRSVAHALEARLTATADEATRGLLADAARVERAACDATTALDDYTAERLRALVRPTWDEAVLDGTALDGAARFAPPPEAELVWTEHDWPEWLATPTEPSNASTPPSSAPTAWLLVRRQQRLRPHRLTSLAAAMVQKLADTGASIDVLIDSVGKFFSAALRERVESVVVGQLEQLYRAEFVDRVPPTDADDGRGHD
ncbi:MAG: lanthionine synthetase LanC family protein [Acidobacteriota bacterium]